jgi:hypothetical protein
MSQLILCNICSWQSHILSVCLSVCLPVYLSIYSCCSQFEHRASVKLFVSLQFLNLRQSVELLGRGINRARGRYLYKHRFFLNSHSGGCSPNGSIRHVGHSMDGWLWWWRIWWNEDWQGKSKYLEKTCPCATLSTTNLTWPDPGLNPGCRGGKPVTNRLSYGAAHFMP